MKENEKRISLIIDEDDPDNPSHLTEGGDKRTIDTRRKKMIMYMLMGIAFLGCLYLIFKPAAKTKATNESGINGSVPGATEPGMQADKGKAYEAQQQEDKAQEKRKALTTLADYWNEDSSSVTRQGKASDTGNVSEGRPNGQKTANPALESYRSAQHTLGSFYQNDRGETEQLRREVQNLKEQLSEKSDPKPNALNDQLALMEKSYQMASRYFPSGTSNAQKARLNDSMASPSNSGSGKNELYPLTAERKNMVSYLVQGFKSGADRKESRRPFYTSGITQETVNQRNSIKACIQESQRITTGNDVRLRLLEAARIGTRTIPEGTLLIARSTLQDNRLQLTISSIELNGAIIPVEISVYDLDGQKGLNVSSASEVSALKEMAGNMSQGAGSSIMLTRSAGQQIASDLSRGLLQGISGYFSKKIRAPKITIKAGYQVLLVSKK